MADTFEEDITYNQDEVVATTDLLTKHSDPQFSKVQIGNTNFAIDLDLFKKIKDLHNKFPSTRVEDPTSPTPTSYPPIIPGRKELENIKTSNVGDQEFPIDQVTARQELLNPDNNSVDQEPEYSEDNHYEQVCLSEGSDHNNSDFDSSPSGSDNEGTGKTMTMKAGIMKQVEGPKMEVETHLYDVPASALDVLQNEEQQELNQDVKTLSGKSFTLKRKHPKKTKKIPSGSAIGKDVNPIKGVTFEHSQPGERGKISELMKSSVSKALQGLSKMTSSTQEQQTQLLNNLNSTPSLNPNPSQEAVPKFSRIQQQYNKFQFSGTEKINGAFMTKNGESNAISREEVNYLMEGMRDELKQFRLHIMEMVNTLLAQHNKTVTGLQANLRDLSKIILSSPERLQQDILSTQLKSLSLEGPPQKPTTIKRTINPSSSGTQEVKGKLRKKPAPIKLGRVNPQRTKRITESTEGGDPGLNSEALENKIKSLLGED